MCDTTRVASLEKLVEALAEYVELLEAECSDTAGYLAVHGWHSARVQEGVDARLKIDQALAEVARV